MSFPHDSRPAVSDEGRTTSQREAASDQDMHVLPTRRQAPRILVAVSYTHLAYQDFFAVWKDADADVPVLKTAKAEYEKLK